MKILAIDTTTEACSAAVLTGDSLVHRYEIAPRQHAELLLGMCDTVLAEAGIGLAELDALAFARGPGAFTGVRVATGVAQGIAFAHDLAVVPVSSLAAMAFAAYDQQGASQVMTAIDARMDEVYWACYTCSDAGVTEVVEEQVSPPAEVTLPGEGDWTGVGTGWGTYRDTLLATTGINADTLQPERLPDARYIARLAAFDVANGTTVSAEQAIPVYLRDKVAKKQVK